MNNDINGIKRISALVLMGLAMLIACFALSTAQVSAKDTVYTEGALYYTIDNNSITIVGYFGKDSTVTVPSSIAGVPVNTIGKGAFTGTNATTVNLPDTITTIESGAFTVGTEIVNNYNTSTPDSQEAGDDGEQTGGTGADFSDVDEGDTVEVGGTSMTVTKKKKNGSIELVDANGNTYHSNGSFIISDSTHKPLEGDVRIIGKDGTETVYTALGDEESTLTKIVPIIIIVSAVLIVILVFILLKIRRQKKIQGYDE